MIEVLDEGTVTWLGEVRVPMGNVRTDAWTLPSGEQARGLAAAFVLPEGPVVLGAGGEFAVGGARWRVEEVAAGPGGTGWARVSRVSE